MAAGYSQTQEFEILDEDDESDFHEVDDEGSDDSEEDFQIVDKTPSAKTPRGTEGSLKDWVDPKDINFEMSEEYVNNLFSDIKEVQSQNQDANLVEGKAASDAVDEDELMAQFMKSDEFKEAFEKFKKAQTRK